MNVVRRAATTFVAVLLGLSGLPAGRADDAVSADFVPLAPELRERCLAVLRSGIKSDEFWPSMHAAEALSLAGAGDEVVAALGDRLPRERDDQRRCGLARELVRAGERGNLRVLFAILADVDSTGRVHAAESLFKVGEIGDGKQLRAALEQKDDLQLRLMAAAALAKTGHLEALATLREQLRSEDRAARNTAAFALARVGDRTDIQSLTRSLESETDAEARAMIVCALASLGDPRGREQLDRDLASSDIAVRTFSAECVGYSRAFALRAKLVALLDDPALDTRVRAAQSLIALSLPPSKR